MSVQATFRYGRNRSSKGEKEKRETEGGGRGKPSTQNQCTPRISRVPRGGREAPSPSAGFRRPTFSSTCPIQASRSLLSIADSWYAVPMMLTFVTAIPILCVRMALRAYVAPASIPISYHSNGLHDASRRRALRPA